MAKSTLICANSVYLAKLASTFNPRSFYVGQGCDLSLFDPAAAPAAPLGYSGQTAPLATQRVSTAIWSSGSFTIGGIFRAGSV